MTNIFYWCKSLTTITQIDWQSVTAISTPFYDCPVLSTINILNLGTQPQITSINFSGSPWVNGVVDTLLANSYDRAAAGYSTCTLSLNTKTKNVLTNEQKAAITAKGYTIS